MIEIYSLTVVEARNLKSVHWEEVEVLQGCAPSRASPGESVLAPASFWWLPALLDLWPYHSSLRGQCLQISLCYVFTVFTHLLLCVRRWKFF